jgi:hypothetical protein
MAAKKSADLTVVEGPITSQSVAPHQPEGATILAMIDKIAALPDVPVEKIEQLWSLHERMESARAKRAYLSDLALMQPELPVIEKKGAINTNEKDKQGNKTGNQIKQSNYAKWEDVVEGIRPVMAKYGFSISFKTDQSDPARIAVTGTLGHREGHSESTTMSLPIDSSGSKNNVQGWGSSVSYGKRYVAFALLNIVARGEDDDGKSAGKDFITDEQANTLLTLIRDTKSDPQQFLEIAGVEMINDIPAANFKVVEGLLLAKKRKQGAPV